MSNNPNTRDSLAASVQFLRGVGPRRSGTLEKIGVRTIRDLLFCVPRRYLDRTAIVTVAELRERVSISTGSIEKGESAIQQDFTVVGEVRSFRVMGVGRKGRFVLVLADKSGSLQCVWFGGVQYWKTKFNIGDVLAVSGQPSLFGSLLQFVHPDVDKIRDRDQDNALGTEGAETDWSTTLTAGGFVPIYPSGKDLESVGLDSGGFRRLVQSVIRQRSQDIEESLPSDLLRSRSLISLQSAIQKVHSPLSADDVPVSLKRLKYEEFFYFQLNLALKRHLAKDETEGISFETKSKLARLLVDSLPFELTNAQKRVIKEIASDMESPKPLNRLLQGDVGSGKTIVALIAMLIAIDNGYQAVLMVPTEILAEQHFATISRLLTNLPINIRLLVGGQRSKLRRDVLDDIQRGSAQIVVGTHALFEGGVEFANLGFVVIDEQHRFGVMQRASLRGKGKNPDVLVMTATPIPRTLSLTVYGDLDVSIIDELPKNRIPIKTALRYEEEQARVISFVREQIALGRQAYFVYPLVEESEKLQLKAATKHFEELSEKVFPGLRLGLLHGRLSIGEKDAVMQKFIQKEIDILVATTVIEVGIDVPNASVMVIENAERFGLSQLHQLRGRVGRGSEQSYCILMTKKWVAKRAERLTASNPHRNEAIDQERLAERRLATMVATNDGFKIAEVDLQLRGPGDFFGTRQSGLLEFKVADIITDSDLLELAREDAFTLIQRDPHLKMSEHEMIAHHLRTYFSEAHSLMRIA